MTQAENIKALRLTLGISKSEFGKKIGVDRNTVTLWENGKTIPRGHYAETINELFGDISDMEMPENVQKEKFNAEEERLKAIAQNRKAINRSFIAGNCYSISDNTHPIESNILQQPILRYERKEGIHHVFRAVRGKWIVTYTDAQLVGKTIKEVI